MWLIGWIEKKLHPLGNNFIHSSLPWTRQGGRRYTNCVRNLQLLHANARKPGRNDLDCPSEKAEPVLPSVVFLFLSLVPTPALPPLPHLLSLRSGHLLEEVFPSNFLWLERPRSLSSFQNSSYKLSVVTVSCLSPTNLKTPWGQGPWLASLCVYKCLVLDVNILPTW